MNYQEDIDTIIKDINNSINRLQSLSTTLYNNKDSQDCIMISMIVLSHVDSINKNITILNHTLMKKYMRNSRMMLDWRLIEL